MEIYELKQSGCFLCWMDISEWEIDTSGFSVRRIKRLAEIKNEKEKRRSAGAELMLIHAVKTLFPDRPIPVQYDADRNGKPYFTEMDGAYFSFSHSGKLAVCAVSDAPVGVDVQAVRKISEGIAKKYFTARERDRLSRGGAPEFTRIWTRKEAVSKAVGLGVQIGFEGLDVLAAETEYNGQVYSIEDIDCGFDGYCMALSRLRHFPRAVSSGEKSSICS